MSTEIFEYRGDVDKSINEYGNPACLPKKLFFYM